MRNLIRLALQAGNIRDALRLSREARALNNLNATGGVRRPGRASEASEYLRNQGVDVDAMTSPGTGDPYMDFVGPYPSGFVATAPRGGGVVVDSGSGSRSVFTGSGFDQRFPRGLEGTESAPIFGTRNPIEAPYEGFRAFNGVEEYVPDWVGRGNAPAVDQPWLESHGYYDAYRPYDPMDPELMGYTGYMNVPPVFGGAGPYGDPMTAFTRSYRRPPRYSFDDITGGFVDRGPSIQF